MLKQFLISIELIQLLYLRLLFH
uniref:Uncharacterized protein n=1 Tax=Tetranychus urticae TaxID=32264 RepID=T1KBV8_TETUR